MQAGFGMTAWQHVCTDRKPVFVEFEKVRLISSHILVKTVFPGPLCVEETNTHKFNQHKLV